MSSLFKKLRYIVNKIKQDFKNNKKEARIYSRIWNKNWKKKADSDCYLRL